MCRNFLLSFDLTAAVDNWTSDDLLTAYRTACDRHQVKPIGLLVDQLKVGGICSGGVGDGGYYDGGGDGGDGDHNGGGDGGSGGGDGCGDDEDDDGGDADGGDGDDVGDDNFVVVVRMVVVMMVIVVVVVVPNQLVCVLLLSIYHPGHLEGLVREPVQFALSERCCPLYCGAVLLVSSSHATHCFNRPHDDICCVCVCVCVCVCACAGRCAFGWQTCGDSRGNLQASSVQNDRPGEHKSG